MVDFDCCRYDDCAVLFVYGVTSEYLGGLM